MAYSTFTSEFRVRPDDIDMFQHVHNSKYFDYVLAARYEQMERCYGMSMEEFMDKGLGWVVRTAYVDYKRALKMGEEFLVSTSVESIHEKGCRVKFEIKIKKTDKIACDGWFDYTMINMKSGAAVKVSEEVIEKYSI